MRLKSNLAIRQVGDQYITVIDGTNGLDYTSVITLNESAASVVEAFKGKELDVQKIADHLFANYDVSEECALNDAKELLGKIAKTGLVDPE